GERRVGGAAGPRAAAPPSPGGRDEPVRRLKPISRAWKRPRAPRSPLRGLDHSPYWEVGLRGFLSTGVRTLDRPLLSFVGYVDVTVAYKLSRIAIAIYPM